MFLQEKQRKKLTSLLFLFGDEDKLIPKTKKLISFNLKKVIKKDFAKSLLTLMSGTAIAQIISILAIPILTRIYTPEEFGIFGVFFSLSSVIASISSGRFELAIMLPKEDTRALHLFALSFGLVVVTSVLSLFFVLIFNEQISGLLNTEGYKSVLYFVPLSVFFLGTYKIFYNWFSRKKEFKSIAFSYIAKNSTSVSSKIGFGFFILKEFGLIAGEIIGQFSSVFLLFLKNRRLNPLKNLVINKATLKKEIKENKNFPIFSMPMAFLNSISVDILIYVLTFLFNTTIVGLYLQASKVINYPLNFISSSFTTVFYQKITTTKNKLRLYFYSYLISFLSALLILFPVLIWGRELFGFVLGENWAFSGNIAQALIPIAVAGFATRNVSSVFSFLKLQQILLIWQIVFLGTAILIFILCKGQKLIILLTYFSFFGASLYIVLGIIGYLVLKKHRFKI
ncbi:MAG: oligosaccharide flippase family protein [Bacteroidales bacterium]|nr:oligosaccharide flippase family protein [Bacteroidales bacterium]